LAIFIIHVISLSLEHRLTSFTHALYPLWVSFDPSNFAEVFRSLEVVEGIVDRCRCARAKLVVHLRERYKRLITREIVAFNFSPRNLTKVTIAMKPVQDSIVGFSSVRELLFAKGYIKDRTRIKQPKLNLVTVGRDSSFPYQELKRERDTRTQPTGRLRLKESEREKGRTLRKRILYQSVTTNIRPKSLSVQIESDVTHICAGR